MSTSRHTAGRRAVVSLMLFVGTLLPTMLSGQIAYPHPYGVPQQFPAWDSYSFDTFARFPVPHVIQEPSVSADLLRHPLSGKAQRALRSAAKRGRDGDHHGAILELREALVKFPKAAPYAHNLMGVEYVNLKQFTAAKGEFEQVLAVMPHVSANHSNYGLALAALGQDVQAEQELRTALVLDETNQNAKLVLDAMRQETSKSATSHPKP